MIYDIYLCMPLTNGGDASREAIMHNRWVAETVGAWLQTKGYSVFVPHTALDPEIEKAIMEEYGRKEGSKILLSTVSLMVPECAMMVVAGDYHQSSGCMYEMCLASELDMDIEELNLKEVFV
jgi:hypothetical protein